MSTFVADKCLVVRDRETKVGTMTVKEQAFAGRARRLIENELDKQGMSKTELCRRAGIPYSTFKARIKSRERGLKVQDLMAIAKVLDFHPAAFFDDEVDEDDLPPFSLTV